MSTSTPGGALAVLVSGAHGTGSAAAWLLPALVPVALGAAYLTGVARLRGSGRRWSGGRTASFLLGSGLVGLALSPAVDAGTAGAHTAQHLLLGMFAPIALVLGAPATLLLAGLPLSARRPVAVLLRSRALHVLSHVATAGVLHVGGLYVLYLTPLYALSARSDVVHSALHLHFLLAGYLFAWAVAGPDPAPRRPGTAVRLAVLVVAGGLHAFLAKLLYSRAPALPVGAGHGVADVEAAAQAMYYGGHLADLVLLVALFAARYRRRGRTRPPAAVAPAGPGRHGAARLVVRPVVVQDQGATGPEVRPPPAQAPGRPGEGRLRRGRGTTSRGGCGRARRRPCRR